MNQYIMKELMNRGFFESNGILSKFINSNQYTLVEDQGNLTVERTFDGDDDTKNRVLDFIQSLAGRYALTGARIRGGRLRIALTKPSSNAREEAVRIDFLIQSLEVGINEIIEKFQGAVSLKTSAPAVTITAADLHRFDEEIPPAAKVRAEDITRSEMPQFDPSSAAGAKNPLAETQGGSTFVDDDEIIDEEEYYKYKAVPEKKLDDTSRFHFPEEVTGRNKQRSRNAYIPQDPIPYEGTEAHPVYANVVDRRFSLIGIFGAGLGVILGAILLGVVRTLGYPAQLAAILVPFLIIGVYRLMAGYQMPIWLGVTFVLISLLMGSVLVTTTDILSTSSVGFLSAFKSGILAHVDNKNFYVGNVWLKYGVSVLAASIPTMLLLAVGKRKTKVY